MSDKNDNNKTSYIRTMKSILFSLISIVLALLFAVIFVMISTKTGFFESAKILFTSIWEGSFGDKDTLAETLVFVTPLLFTGLANAVAFKTGLFNIGVEGQFISGMTGAAIIGLIPGIPHVLHVILIILGGIICGGIWAGIPGFLKAKSGTNEVVSTIMMNFIAMYLLNYLTMFPLNDSGQAQSLEIQESAKLARILGQTNRTSSALILGLILVFVMYFFMWKTTSGYELRAVGLSALAAEYGGISIKKNIILAMVISGAIAGIGGATHVAGIQYKSIQLFGFPNFGFTGIAVALLAKSNPIGVIFSSILFGALDSSSLTLQMNGVPKDIVYLVQAIIILFVAGDGIYKIIGDKMKKRREVKVNE